MQKHDEIVCEVVTEKRFHEIKNKYIITDIWDNPDWSIGEEGLPLKTMVSYAKGTSDVFEEREASYDKSKKLFEGSIAIGAAITG
jgi:hypothetical protein